MIQYVVTVTWYKPVMTALAVFLTISCAAFLATFRPRQQRGLVAAGMVWLALGVIAHTVPPMWQLWGSGLPAPRFASHRHAFGALVPFLLDVVAVCILLVWLTNELGRRRAERRRASGDYSGGGWSVSRRLGQRRRARRSPGRRTPGRGTPGHRSDTAGLG